MSQSRTSNRAALAVLFALLLVPGLAFAQDGSGNQGGLNNLVGLQPVLIYTISNNFTGSFGSNNGGTGGGGGLDDGAIVSSLIVYSNGLAVWNSTEGNDGGTTGNDSGVQVAFMSQDQLTQLRQSLRRSGAFRSGGLGRQQLNNASEDSLIATVTVFLNEGNGNRSLAHTTTFFVGDQNTGRTLQLQNFLQTFTNDFFGTDGSGGSGGSGGGSGS